MIAVNLFQDQFTTVEIWKVKIIIFSLQSDFLNLFIAHEGDGVGTSSVLCDADVDATDDHQVGTFLWKEALMRAIWAPSVVDGCAVSR